MLRFNGMEVVVHRRHVVARTWRERLFTRPWRPLERTKVSGPKVPDDQWYIIGGRIHVSEDSFDALLNGSIKG